jgi:hypothetical protein
MPRTTNAAGRIRDESLMNLGGRGKNKTLSLQYKKKKIPNSNVQRDQQ